MKTKVLAIILLAITLCTSFYGAYLVYLRYRVIPVSAQPLNTQISKKDPILFEIPSLDLSLPIKNARIINRKWDFNGEGVFYLEQSPIPGDIGNSIIFGHNWPNLLGNLKNAKKGDVINITFNNGDIKKFEIFESYTVTPDQTHILNQTEDTRLSVYTCTGFLDSKRLLVVAKLVKP